MPWSMTDWDGVSGLKLRLDARRASHITRLALTFFLLDAAEDARFELARRCHQHAFQFCFLLFTMGR
jgi:hypothetical protein